jgi:ABC-type dipeptide/oligopeptide/nickel transport system ATPase subunit
MAALTSKQLTQLGDSFLSFAQLVGNYRMQNRAAMSKTQNEKISALHHELLDQADEFYTSSAKLVMDDVKVSLEKIKEITSHINESYSKLKKIQKAIDIAAAAVNLGGKLLTKDPAAVIKAIKELEEEI